MNEIDRVFSGASESQQMSEVFALLTASLSKKQNNKSVEQVQLILNYWKSQKLPLMPLQSFILKNINSTLPGESCDVIEKLIQCIGILCVLLEENVGSQFPWELPFSAETYLFVVQAFLKQEAEKQSKSFEMFIRILLNFITEGNEQAFKVSDQKLWKEIKENLDGGSNKRNKVVIPHIVINDAQSILDEVTSLLLSIPDML